MKKPLDYLFTNGRGGRLTEASIQKIVAGAALKVGIKNETTQIYTKVALNKLGEIKSPLD